LLALPDAGAARRLFRLCAGELTRLEGLFSLYRADSYLSRLNREGMLPAPPPEFLDLLVRAQAFAGETEGAFDITVQPLWALYHNHFARPDADPAGPPPVALRRARGLVDYRRLDVAPQRVAFARPGMAATLNGIAQGYITDRICELLRVEGATSVLADFGENRALGGHPEGGPWRVGLLDPFDPGRLADVVELENRALATSGGYGFRFDRAGRFHHLLDPATGDSARRFASVTVIARDATTADALSTALSVLDEERGRAALARHGAEARLTYRDGRVQRIG
jgi:thiamine biosynthesis lipoprotein